MWLIGKWKIGLVLFAVLAVAGLYFSKLRSDLRLARMELSIADAKTAADEKQKLKAIQVQSALSEINEIRNQISMEAINATDPSYGCTVNADGMRLIRSAKNDPYPSSKPNRALQED